MFTILRIPSQIESLLIELQQFFNDYQWLHFKSLLLALIITPYRQTTNGICKILSFGAHRSKHNEFLIDCLPILNKVLRFYALLILQKLYKRGCPVTCIIDDTSNKKRGKHMQAAFKFFDHVSNQYIIGHQVVCMVISYRGFIIPYAAEIYQPKSTTSPKPAKKKTHIAAQMLESFSPAEGQKVYVVADTFYACTEIIQSCRKSSYVFVSALKTNRVVTVDGKRQNVSSYLSRVYNKTKNKRRIKLSSGTYEVLSRTGTLKSGGAVKLVCTRNLSHYTVKVLFTTDPALPFDTIIAIYQLRWSIEVFFKEEKQHLGLKINQHQRLEANASTIMLSCIAYNLMTHVFVNQQRKKGCNITAKVVAEFNVQNMKTNICNLVAIDSLQNIIELKPGISRNNLVKTIKKYLLVA
jgi:SRSO17 transposase